MTTTKPNRGQTIYGRFHWEEVRWWMDSARAWRRLNLLASVRASIQRARRSCLFARAADREG